MASNSPTLEKCRNWFTLQRNRFAHGGGRFEPGPYGAVLCLVALAGWVCAGALWVSPLASRVARQSANPKATVSIPVAAPPKGPVPAAPEPSATTTARQRPLQPGVKIRPYLGIRGKSFRRGSQTGLTILEVFPGSPAALAGLRSKDDPMRTYGDIIVKANDRRIASADDIRALLQASKPGDVVRLLVRSAGGESFHEVSVTLGSIPVAAAAARARVKSSVHHAHGMSDLERRIFEQVNRVRQHYGCSPLIANPRLDEAARRHSARMAAMDFFSHTDPDGQTVVERLRAVGIDRFKAVGENIFYGQDLSDVVHVVVEGWLKSPSHRENLLSKGYRQAGVGVAHGPDGSIYVTQDYLQQ